MPLDELEGADINPKGHDEQGIAASLRRFGYVESIVLDERTGKLVAGHGRLDQLRAAKEAGEDPPDGIVVTKGEWTVPVTRGWASKDDNEAKAYLVASNELTSRGGWADQQGLADLLTQLQDGPGLDGVGFTTLDLEDLLTQLTPPTLADLRHEHGAKPTEADMWPLLRLKLEPGVLAAFEKALGDEGTDTERVQRLLDRLA